MNVVLIAECSHLIGGYWNRWGSANIVDRGYAAIYMKQERFAGAVAELTRRGVWVESTPHAPVYYDCEAHLASLPERDLGDEPFALGTGHPFTEEYVGWGAAGRRDERLAQFAAAGFSVASLEVTIPGRFGLHATRPSSSGQPLIRTLHPQAGTFDERTASAFVEHYTEAEWGIGDTQWPIWKRISALMEAGWRTRWRGPVNGAIPGTQCLHVRAPWRVDEFDDPRDIEGFRKLFEIHHVVRLGLMPATAYPPPNA